MKQIPKIKYTNQLHSTKLVERHGVPYIIFPLLEKEGVIHGFSTRLGGVSEGCFSSMNLSFSRGDHEESVRKITKE